MMTAGCLEWAREKRSASVLGCGMAGGVRDCGLSCTIATSHEIARRRRFRGMVERNSFRSALWYNPDMSRIGFGEACLERMVRAVEKVRERLLRACRALDDAGVPYAVGRGK